MDRSYMINEYINDSDKSFGEVQESSQYLDGLKSRIHDCKRLTEIMVEVSKFIDKYNVTGEIKDGLLKICNEFDEKTDVYTAKHRLEEFLAKNLEEKEVDYNNKEAIVTDIKTDVIEDAKDRLESVGIDLVGDNEKIINDIDDVTDVYRIKNNVENVENYFYDRNKAIGDDNPTTVEVSLDKISDVVESSNDDIILNEALNTEEKALESENPSLFEANSDGTVQINGDSHIPDSMNFAAMMTSALMVQNDIHVPSDLDMKFMKEKSNKDSFKIIYGKFPLTNHPENKLDPVIVSKISELADSYNSGNDYMQLLGTTSPELKEALSIINNHVLNEAGAFQMAVKTEDNMHNMAFRMDESYHDVLSAFNNNGAYVSYDASEHGIATVNETVPGNQLLILSSTNEELNKEKNIEMKPELNNVYQYVKKNENKEAANVSYTFLKVIIVAEIMLVGMYLMFFLNK